MGNGNLKHTDDVTELLVHIQNGSSGAFVKLAEKYAPLLDGEVARYVDILSSADLDDLRQGALVSLYRAAIAFDPTRGVTFGLFAKICIVNGIADTLRYLNKKTSDVSMELLDETELSPVDDNPQNLMLDKEELLLLKQKIALVLSKLEYRIFELYLSGYSYAEIALKIERSEKSVDNALRRIKEKLKRIL